MFQWLLHSFDVKDVQSTAKNLQSILNCERMHQTVVNVLKALLFSNPQQKMTQARDIFDQALASAMHDMQVTTASTLGSMLGALAFSRDMFMNVPLIVDWHTIAQCREQYVNDNLRSTNRKRRQYDYVPGQKVLKKVHGLVKLGVRTTGPYNIEHVHVNGTLTIELHPGITEHINICNFIPYRT
jgi:hypothetical protein